MVGGKSVDNILIELFKILQANSESPKLFPENSDKNFKEVLLKLLEENFPEQTYDNNKEQQDNFAKYINKYLHILPFGKGISPFMGTTPEYNSESGERFVTVHEKSAKNFHRFGEIISFLKKNSAREDLKLYEISKEKLRDFFPLIRNYEENHGRFSSEINLFRKIVEKGEVAENFLKEKVFVLPSLGNRKGTNTGKEADKEGLSLSRVFVKNRGEGEVSLLAKARGYGEDLYETNIEVEHSQNRTGGGFKLEGKPPVKLAEDGSKASFLPESGESASKQEGLNLKGKEGLAVNLNGMKELVKHNTESEEKKVEGKLFQEVQISEGKNLKKIVLKTENFKMDVKLFKDSVSLKLLLGNSPEHVFTNIDAIKISQIFQSAGFRVESLNVNGSEWYRERGKSRERGNISNLDETSSADISTHSTDSSFSLLL